MLRVKKLLAIDSKNSIKIIEILNQAGAKARFVGGIVRDTLLNIPTSDIDIATDADPLQVMNVLKTHKIKAIPTGIKFGTVTAIIETEIFEITTLRRDLFCDGRHAQVGYSNDFKEDAARRDFTINALSYCPMESEIFDYFGGIDDLNNRRVVFIGKADERIEEDYLRILRFFRFSCKYAKELNHEGLAACIKYKDKLKFLSRERIKQEMDKILLLPSSPYVIKTMYDTRIMQIILPVKSYDTMLHIRLLEVAQQYKELPSIELIYAMILECSLKNLLDLRFSRTSATKIVKLQQIKQSVNIESLEILLKTIWLQEQSFVEYFILADALRLGLEHQFISKLYNRLKDKALPKFPITGHDLAALGLRGQKIGYFMKYLRDLWIKSDFNLNKQELIQEVKDK